jgi:hypothetical protein
MGGGKGLAPEKQPLELGLIALSTPGKKLTSPAGPAIVFVVEQLVGPKLEHIMIKKQKRVHCLIRFGCREWVEDFCKGKLYMNTLKYFKQIEANDPLRGDKSEGLCESHPADMCQLFIQEDLEWLPIKGMIGQLRFDDPSDKDTNIFSLYAITEENENLLVHDRVLGFGDTAAIILQGDEFLIRVKKAFEKKGWAYDLGLVDYVDKNKYSGEMGAFRKYSDLDFQREFRIATKTKRQGPIDDFHIGDISDIIRVCDSKKVCDLFKIEKT